MLYSEKAVDLYTTNPVSKIEKMRSVALRTDYLIRETFKQIESGMSDIDIQKTLVNLFKSDTSFVPDNVSYEKLGWQKNICPIIFVNDLFWKGHPHPTGEILNRGGTISIDFGISFKYNDETTYSSDLQRSAYVLNDGELIPPEKISHFFSTLYNAVQKGSKKIVPGNFGQDAHERIRGFMESYGFDYGLFSGHTVSDKVHDNVVTICAGSKQKLKENQVIALEPKITVNNGMSLEEMIICKEEPEFLIPPQENLILIH